MEKEIPKTKVRHAFPWPISRHRCGFRVPVTHVFLQMISASIISDRLKVNMSVARRAMAELVRLSASRSLIQLSFPFAYRQTCALRCARSLPDPVPSTRRASSSPSPSTKRRSVGALLVFDAHASSCIALALLSVLHVVAKCKAFVLCAI